MLDFDFVCSREEPSVAAMVYPFTGDHKQKFYWGHKEILVPGMYDLFMIILPFLYVIQGSLTCSLLPLILAYFCPHGDHTCLPYPYF